jgi:hypothetical protein
MCKVELRPYTTSVTELPTRAGRVTEDLDKNAFAAQQTLEVIWRELDELIVELLVE